MNSFTTIKAAASGRWPDIWAALGVGDLPPPGRHGPCPGCGGRDRFRLVPEDADDGGWICGQGGHPTGGDGFALLVHCGIARSPGEALRMVAAHLGIDARPDPQARQKARQAARQREMARLETALLHELIILEQVVGSRVAGRELTRHHRALPPEWRPMPDDHWQRETLAAQRIAALLGKLYKARRMAA